MRRPPRLRAILGPIPGALHLSQTARQLTGRLRPLRGILGQAPEHETIERRRQRRGEARGWWCRRRVGVLEEQAEWRVGGEYVLPRQQPVCQAAGGVDVGPPIEWRADGLLDRKSVV